MQCAAKAPSSLVAAAPTRQRGRSLRVQAVAAQPAATKPLTKDDLVAYVASGCKPKDKWRCARGCTQAAAAVAAAAVPAGRGSCAPACPQACLRLQPSQLKPCLPATSTNIPGLPPVVQPPRDCCCRIGTEHEKLGYRMADTKRPTHEQIAALLRGIQERFGWQPIIENGNIIGLLQDGQSVTLEPGGQFELSGATVDTLHKTCAEVNSHLYQVRCTCRGSGRQQAAKG